MAAIAATGAAAAQDAPLENARTRPNSEAACQQPKARRRPCLPQPQSLAKSNEMTSFADDRRFLQVAKSLKSVEAVAKELGRSPETVAKTAMRWGVSLKKAEARRTKNTVKLGLKAKTK